MLLHTFALIIEACRLTQHSSSRRSGSATFTYPASFNTTLMLHASHLHMPDVLNKARSLLGMCCFHVMQVLALPSCIPNITILPPKCPS